MKVLYLCHRFPFPPRRGGTIRQFQTIRHLHEQGHEVTVCSIVRSEKEAREGAGLAQHCAAHHMIRLREPLQIARMVANLPLRAPSSMGYVRSGELSRCIRRQLSQNRFDLVLANCSAMAPYVEAVNDVPKLLDFGDMDSQKWLAYTKYKPFPLSLGYRIEGRKLMLEEKRLSRLFDVCTTTTRAELETLEGYGSAKDVDWFPNGVDSDFFCPSEQGYDPDTISFVGQMSYYPNQECMQRFCDSVWPLLKSSRPRMKLFIVGADPGPAVRALSGKPDVVVTGFVPDVRPFLRDSALMVAPLAIARGTQNKILEAMATGVPVVTSWLAAAGVDAQPGEHLAVADSPEEIAAAVLRIAGDPAERARLARAGRERMLSHHGWPASMRRLDAILDRCRRGFSSRPSLAHAGAAR